MDLETFRSIAKNILEMADNLPEDDPKFDGVLQINALQCVMQEGATVLAAPSYLRRVCVQWKRNNLKLRLKD